MADIQEAIEASFVGQKKKKKKNLQESNSQESLPDSTSVPLEEEQSSVPISSEDPALLFSQEMKKKKKKKKEVIQEPENEVNSLETVEKEGETGQEPWLHSTRDYTYQELLQRIFNMIRQNNPELAGEKKKFTIPPPQVAREGTKKTMFANIMDICKRMRRNHDHLVQYIFAELGTSGSIDGSNRLLIKGRFQQKQIEIVLKRYIVEYVQCKTCRSPDTNMVKENRLFFLNCESCGSSRTVAAIKTGFLAQTGKRAAQRANA